MNAKVAFSLFFACTFAFALDSADQEALQKTKDLLTNKNEREKSIQNDSKAQQADAYAKQIGGSPEKTEKIYQLSAQIFEKLVKKYGGDTEKIKAVIEKAQKDPAGFAKTEFTEEEMSALKELGRQLSAPSQNLNP